MSNAEDDNMQNHLESNAPASARRSEDAGAMDSEGTTFIEGKPKETAIQAPWTPGTWPRFPWIASLSLLLSLCAAGCMIFIAAMADHSNVSSWTVSPPVLLAIASTLANTLIHVALARGAAVTWWFLSMHPDRQTRVKDLHWRWAAAEGLVDALESIFTRGFSRTAIACSFATIVAVNSPLLQRALTVRTQESITVGAAAGPIHAAPQLPAGFGAFVGDRNLRITNPTEEFSLLLAEYNSRSPIVLPRGDDEAGGMMLVGPNKTFRTTIQAAGYHVDCYPETTIKLPSFEELDDKTRGGGPSGQAAYTNNLTDIFVSSVSYLEEYGFVADAKILATKIRDPLRDSNSDSEAAGRVFWYDSVWKAESGCINETHGAELKVRKCDIVPAVVKYPVLIDSNNSITLLELDQDRAGGRFSDEVVPGSVETREQAINETQRAGWQLSTHGGLALFLNNRFSANYTIRGDSFLLDMGYWESYVDGFYPYELLRTGKSRCDRWFMDPGPPVFEAVRELGLRSALMAANSSDPLHRLDLVGQTTETIAVYVANFGFLYGAVAVTVLAALSVIPLFYGFWKLGREVSLSPLETAKAFRPAQLEGVPSNSTVERLLKSLVGSRPIRYGVIIASSDDGEQQDVVLGMDDPNLTIHPDEM
ncbi:hypothetical protein QBC44DRAFT_285417 [Cladorrhinum sp. PSN332]|nr:hypothetical protein QBC44DRAFT_285417 [Cladorrhinum sp. PSN332]